MSASPWRIIELQTAFLRASFKGRTVYMQIVAIEIG